MLHPPRPRRVRRTMLGIVLTLLSCGGGTSDVAQAPVATRVVVIPASEDEVAGIPSVSPAAICPPDAFAEQGRCVRVVASPEIPAWTAPSGHLDPCATWTSDKGIYDCDPSKENPGDAGLR